MAAPFPNLYTHRKVAEASAKSCDICYKLSTSVLITPDKKDFFYVCPIHLKDVYFCTPKIDEDAAKAKREKELAEETEKLKKEYEERHRKKKEKESKDKDKESKEDGKDKGKDKEDGNDKKEDDSKSKDEEQGEEPRVFELKSAFYKQRIQRKRQSEVAKRDRERASQPNYFPSVPTDLPRK
ncbi:AAA-ATPase vps4-associated protein 1 domain-containing protein [Hirsutella rhossiliensis]|uniref:AAA-ATPase vps4-associated protein 1 domain-containing protein n=1 Tax=Hirsutella rhossiliensis TaxID=111463 RepID=A0A9P8SNE4_9HYPO|nr:AAA-ATPase vps4-associated protein 1 domain-containing protein [Hirsutella rhossiliensis]KAH0967790.1 AAA-ATPase vps4-associated protein 1 domain-containing protein [Hirsutella rhossiliensis]